jgi:hypothetical protein
MKNVDASDFFVVLQCVSVLFLRNILQNKTKNTSIIFALTVAILNKHHKIILIIGTVYFLEKVELQ